MELLIFRHGEAEKHGRKGDDASRALTAKGVEGVERAARGLARLVDRPDVILTSPKVRALKTAEILGEEFNLKPKTVDALSIGTAAQALRVLGHYREKSLLIVGHEPMLSRIVEQLCTRGRTGGFVLLRKASCACVKVRRLKSGTFGAGQLVWLATAKMLRGAGKK